MTPTRSRGERMIAARAAGSPAIRCSTRNLRIVCVARFLLPGPQVVTYLLLWFVMPDDDRPRSVYR